MIPKQLIPSLCLLFTASAFYCSSVQSTGGTGTETVNTFARLPDGTPAAGAVARLIDARWWIDSIHHGTSPVIGEGVADGNGHILIVYEGRHPLINLQIDHGSGALVTTLQDDRNCINADTVCLKKPATLAGTFENQSSSGAKVLLAGTAYEAVINQTGSYSFGKIAPGSYAVVTTGTKGTDVAGNSALTLHSGTVNNDYELDVPADRVLIDNFESGVGPTSLGRIFPVLGWYVLSDSIYYYWHTGTDKWTRGISAVIGHSPIFHDSVKTPGNTAFSVSTILDRVSPLANSVAGVQFRPLSKTGIDLSSMTGFSLRASGKGIVRVRFESMRLDSASLYLSNYSYPLELVDADTLTEYTIPVDSLRILEPVETPKLFPWSRESKNIVRIEFEFSTSENDRGDSLYCTLDDLYLEGVSITAFMK